MTKLLLIRHGETMFNRARRLQGCKDVPPLSDLGTRQADACANYIASLNRGTITALYSSPLARAYMTASAIGKAVGLDVVTDDRLKEIDVGALEGMTWDEVQLAYPDFMVEHRADPLGPGILEEKASRMSRREHAILPTDLSAIMAMRQSSSLDMLLF